MGIVMEHFDATSGALGGYGYRVISSSGRIAKR